MATQRELSNSEIADLLLHHPEVALQVAATKAAMLVLSPDQIDTPPAWYQFDVNVGLVPSWGVSVVDPTYGTVVIAWDARYNWHYNGWTAVSDAAINAPPYQSDPGPLLPNLPDLGTLGLYLVLGFLAFAVIQKEL